MQMENGPKNAHIFMTGVLAFVYASFVGYLLVLL